MYCEIEVRELLDHTWSEWFDGLEITQRGEDVTVMAGEIADESALHGLLLKLHDLGLVVISFRRIEI